MEPLENKVFLSWAKKHNWLKVNESVTPNGRQHSYMTPAGNVVIAMYDIEGNLFGFGHPAPPPTTGGQPLFKPR